MAKVSIATATTEERKKWLDKAKKTREKAKLEKQKHLITLETSDTEELKKLTDKLNYSIGAMKVNTLSVKQKEALLEALFIIDTM